MRRPLTILTVLLASGALISGACSSGGSEADATGTAEPAATGTGAPDVPSECEADAATDGAAAEVEARGKPTPEVPEGDAPVDLIEGDGAEVVEDGTVEIQYVISKASDGTEVESSWETGSPASVNVAETFPQFGEAVVGMKEGGRRAFTVAATDVFGAEPPEESGLTAADSVVFTIDLVSTTGSLEDPAALEAAEKRGAPDVEVPEKAPTELEWIDEVEGDGQVVCPGDTVLAHYVGVDISSGETFDSSWDRGEPISFPLDGVIEGWTKGMVGMKVGGRRTLVIPGEQAYGASDEDSEGQPSGDLVFTIDLIGVS